MTATKYLDILDFFARKAEGADDEAPTYLVQYPETNPRKNVLFRFYNKNFFTRMMVVDLIRRDDEDEPLFRSALSGPKHFWETAQKMTNPNIPIIGSGGAVESFAWLDSHWFDTRRGPAGIEFFDRNPEFPQDVTFANRAYWNVGFDMLDNTWDAAWWQTRLELLRAVNDYFPCDDFLETVPEPSPQPVPEPGRGHVVEQGPRLTLSIDVTVTGEKAQSLGKGRYISITEASDFHFAEARNLLGWAEGWAENNLPKPE